MYSAQLYQWMLQAACLAWLWQQVVLHKEGRFHSEEAVAILRWLWNPDQKHWVQQFYQQQWGF